MSVRNFTINSVQPWKDIYCDEIVANNVNIDELNVVDITASGTITASDIQTATLTVNGISTLATVNVSGTTTTNILTSNTINVSQLNLDVDKASWLPVQQAGGTNVTSISFASSSFIQYGNFVSCQLAGQITPTAPATTTRFIVNLPVAPANNFADAYQLIGSGMIHNPVSDNVIPVAIYSRSGTIFLESTYLSGAAASTNYSLTFIYYL